MFSLCSIVQTLLFHLKPVVHTNQLNLIAVLLLLRVLPEALAHGHGDSMAMRVSSGIDVHFSNSTTSFANMTFAQSPQSYFAYSKYSGLMLGHIGLMTIAWVFVLPIGESALENLGT